MASDNSESDAHPPGVVWVQSLKQFWDTFANEKLTSLDKRYKSQLRWFQEHPDARSIVETRRRVDPSELVQRPQQQQNDTKVTADDQQEVDHRDDSMEDDLKHDESQPTTDTPPLQVDTNASVTSLSERQPLNPFAALDQPQRSLWPSLYQQRPLVEQFGSLTQPSLQIGQLQRDLLQHGNTAHPEPSTVIKTPTPPPAFSRPSPDLPPAPHVMNEPVSPIHLVEQPSSDPNMQPPQQPSQLPPKPATMHAQNITLPFDDLNKDADDEVLLVPSHGSLEFDDSASQLGNSFLSTSFNGPPSRPHSFIMDDLNDPPSPKRRNTTTRQSQLSATPVSSHNMTSPQSAHARYSQQSVYSRFSPVSTRVPV
ncbi:hypothetical protein DM01DRAFT_1068468 [Hesseltinella vesiculosa]|uniref:Uncharacterized protein n=1 Tax=Hesseltinella vesiculosa TaxID=101127 RepID=A0A1X2GV30_9FUNG|nr:hypothetical protein DM01DRAFT_1068468 [Hesseltinella vesiculosa]